MQRVKREAGKTQTIYLHGSDVDRAAELEMLVRKSRKVRGRIGLSRLVRAGLKLLMEQYDCDPKAALASVAAVAAGEPDLDEPLTFAEFYR